MSRIIDLEEKYQFRVLLHPVRQEIVHLLRLAGRPLSVNSVAKRMNLSPNAAQSHLKKLVDLGVVLTEQHRNEDGSAVMLYTLDDVDIRLHLGRKDAFQGEREAMAANTVDGVFRGLINTTHQCPEAQMDQNRLFRFGALHLTAEERDELTGLVAAYLQAHGAHTPEKEEHWEYVLMAYRAPDDPRH